MMVHVFIFLLQYSSVNEYKNLMLTRCMPPCAYNAVLYAHDGMMLSLVQKLVC